MPVGVTEIEDDRPEKGEKIISIQDPGQNSASGMRGNTNSGGSHWRRTALSTPCNIPEYPSKYPPKSCRGFPLRANSRTSRELHATGEEEPIDQAELAYHQMGQNVSPNTSIAAKAFGRCSSLSAAKLSASVGGANISVDDTTSLYKNGGADKIKYHYRGRYIPPSTIIKEMNKVNPQVLSFRCQRCKSFGQFIAIGSSIKHTQIICTSIRVELGLEKFVWWESAPQNIPDI
ncbi:hypothetical protein B0H13DRAFT_1931051 [Mycena leptocephala]|nr:hypothetical protein B0H13DRAFT_1931051 [Mycena leptocephala]